ncbi:MAG TPA: hypothetical protein VN922_23330 [Bacteroidia bacterium]|nr:hypothetical protein [Bacteroidia bacterium]
MIETRTIAMALLVAIAMVGAVGITIGTQSAHATPIIVTIEQNPSTGNPHPPGEPTGNPQQNFPAAGETCHGDPHGQATLENNGQPAFGQCPGGH